MIKISVSMIHLNRNIVFQTRPAKMTIVGYLQFFPLFLRLVVTV